MTWDGREYHVFDILWLDGPLTSHAPDRGPARAARAAAAEGAAAPRRATRRRHAVGARLPRRLGRRDRQAARIAVRTSRSKHWLKMKCEARRSWSSAGSPIRRAPASASARCSVGYYDGDDFFFAGKIGTGFDTKLLLDLRRRLDQLEQPNHRSRKGLGYRGSAPTGFTLRSWCRYRLSNGPSTESCVTHG
jgi:hypothetical protein